MKLLTTLFVLLLGAIASADCSYERTDSGDYVYVCSNDEHKPDKDDDKNECWYAYDPQTGRDVLVCE